jgi:hypothetical protein
MNGHARRSPGLPDYNGKEREVRKGNERNPVITQHWTNSIPKLRHKGLEEMKGEILLGELISQITDNWP